MSKIIFVAGVAAGYVLGARAGRERYDQIKKAASSLWQSRTVQKRVDKAQDAVKARVSDVAHSVSNGAKSTLKTVFTGTEAAASEASSSRVSSPKKSQR